MKALTALASIVIISCFSCNSNGSTTEPIDSTLVPSYAKVPEPVNISYRIIAQHPKDTGAYTQGLEIYNGKLYESTGDYEYSSIRITDWKTGKVEQKQMMGREQILGEEINIFN